MHSMYFHTDGCLVLSGFTKLSVLMYTTAVCFLLLSFFKYCTVFLIHRKLMSLSSMKVNDSVFFFNWSLRLYSLGKIQ